MGDAHKLEVAQFPVGGVQADKPAQFLVHKNGAKGNLDGKVNKLQITSRRVSRQFHAIRAENSRHS